MKRFSDILALRLSSWFSSMGCFWLFNALAFLPILFPLSLPYVQFVSSGWLQLVALPLLAVSGVIIGKEAEIRAEQDHQAIMELVNALHDKHDRIHGAKTEGPIS